MTHTNTEQEAPDGCPLDEAGFLREALDVLEDVFYVITPDGTILRLSERAAEVTGYAREAMIGENAMRLFPERERERIQADIQTAIETGEARIEAPLLTKEGREIPYEFRKRRFTDDEGSVIGLVGIGRDIRDRRQRERRLTRQLQQFEHFGSVLSHDLRTPLNTALGRIELARDTGELEHLAKAEAALERLDALIDDLATVMREGELVRATEAVSLTETAQEVWATLETGEATLEVEEELSIAADRQAVLRFLENLLRNSLQHGGSAPRIRIGRLPEGFFIADDGPGIPADVREDIFEIGYTTKSQGEGSGFGLASARQIAVAHGWELVAADADDGARFEVRDVVLK
ncbi:MAG: sensor histidine kinase [Halobacteriaceae archaeon]